MDRDFSTKFELLSLASYSTLVAVARTLIEPLCQYG